MIHVEGLLSRWPVQVVESIWQLILTFVLPLAVITSFPGHALLNKLSPADAATSVAVACGFFELARLVWLRSLRRYCTAPS